MLKLDSRLIAKLRILLDDLQYDEVQRSLRPNYFVWPFSPFETFQQLIAHLPERQRVSYEVLLIGLSAPKAKLEHLWGADLVGTLLELRFLKAVRRGGIRTANYSIVSFLGYYFVVSLNPYYPASRDPNTPIYIGPDSLTLATNLPQRRSIERGLDLCSGSGIQAILAAATAKEVIAVELNQQAARAAQFNAILNDVAERIKVQQGDLYEQVPAGPYDLIISNPPFLPTPSNISYPMCGHGGENGLAVLKPLLEGIPVRLANEGLAIIYAEGVGNADGPFVRSLLEDMVHRQQLDVSIVVVSRLSIKNTLVLKAISLSKLKPQAGKNELIRWRNLYQQLGATHTYNYVLRLKKGSGCLSQMMAFDPRREERGLEIEPGVIIKPRD